MSSFVHSTVGSICGLQKYLTPDGKKKIKEYQYKGEDRSLYYKKVLAPFASWAVQFFPYWLAPNLITLMGLFFNVVAYFLLWYYVPLMRVQTDDECPRWVWLYCAVASWLYQNLDNIDGRQARRTGSSSPLGLLFDHGCDAVNVPLNAFNSCTGINCGVTWLSKLSHVLASSIFYFNTWEEYYTGTLILAEINGPSDGQLVIQIIYLINFFVGPTFWDTVQPQLGITYSTCVVGFVAFSSIMTIIKHLFVVIIRANYKRMKEDGIFIALTRIVPYILLNALFMVWMNNSPQKIFEVHPRLCLWTIAFLNIKLTVHLMLDHLCDEYHHPWRKTLIPFFFVAAHFAFAGLDDSAEFILLYEFFTLSLVSFLHMTIGVCTDVSSALNINVFSIDLEKAHRLVYGKKGN